MKQEKNMRVTALVCYLLLFAVWACLECAVVPKLNAMTLPVSVEVIKEIGLKILIWLIPAVYLIVKRGDAMYLNKGEILGDAKKPVNYIILGAFLLLFSAVQMIPNYLSNGRLVFDPSFCVTAALVDLCVGTTEEFFFRGLLLNTALKDRKPAPVFLGNAVMFLMIHFPLWIMKGLFSSYAVIFSCLVIFVLSLIFSWSFVKSRSIIVPIILHAYWNMLCSALP